MARARVWLFSIRDEGLAYCPRCGWWTRPLCGHKD